MGVSGCGKSTVGALLGPLLHGEFLEGDSLHPARNVARMAAGVALTDDDRHEWLQALAQHLKTAHDTNRVLVVSCSALKRSYRDRLRSASPGLVFVHLHGSPALLGQRLAARTGHYMPASLLASQLDTLEAPADGEHAITLDAGLAPEHLAAQAAAWVALGLELATLAARTPTSNPARP